MDETRKPRLLLADDSATIRKVVEFTFADEGVDVTSVADAQTAMQKFVEIQPDVVLVDVGLNDTSGYRICEMIKADDATRHIPVILLVGSFEPFDQTEAERVCADGFLTKPFRSIRDLVSMVFDFLGKKRAATVGDPDQTHLHTPISDIEDLYTNSVMQPADADDFAPIEDLFADTGIDDELIETSYPSKNFEDDLDIPLIESEADIDKTIDGFDWSPGAAISEDRPSLQATGSPAFEPKFVFEESEEGTSSPLIEDAHVNGAAADPESALLELEPAFAPERASRSNESIPAEPSPEFIAMVAQQVIERLSDKVVREIAQQAVPRIAEKLIREALDEEKKV